MPITQFYKWANQAVNLGAFIGTGKLDYQDPESRQEKMRAQVKELKERGLL